MIMHTINVFHFPGIQWFNCPLAGGVLALVTPEGLLFTISDVVNTQSMSFSAAVPGSP